MNQANELPEEILENLEDNSSCHLLFYFDKNGNPGIHFNAFSPKDMMALNQLMMNFIENTNNQEEDVSDEDDGDFWKKG